MSISEVYNWVLIHLPDSNAIAAFAGAASAIAAFHAIKRNDDNLNKAKVEAAIGAENARLLTHAITTLERAYVTLHGPSAAPNVAPQSRLNWLASARLIESYKTTKARISDSVALEECESHEEHWRHQFYLLLRGLATGHPSYFQEKENIDSSIQPVSAVVVCAFAIWPDDKPDPLDKYHSSNHAAEELGVHLLWRNLRTSLDL
jgi:hypothetical protein